MTKMGRPKSEKSKKKVLSIRVDDPMYRRICAYAEQYNKTVSEVVLQAVEKELSRPQ